MSWRLKDPKSWIYRLIERDGLNCCWCGLPCDKNAEPNTDNYPTIEHVVPRCKGGIKEMDNLKVACFRCNTSRNDREIPSIHTELKKLEANRGKGFSLEELFSSLDKTRK